MRGVMFRSRLDALARRSLLRRLRTIDSAPGPEVELEGRRILLFSSNNYLDLAAHPRVTDGVFSMDGDLAPLPELDMGGEHAGATVVVDDAHGTGVMGATGRGTVEHFGLEGRPLVQMGTLSKALGGLGGFVAGPRDLIE